MGFYLNLKKLDKRETFIKKLKNLKKISNQNKYQDLHIGLVGEFHAKQIEFWLDGEGRIHERLNYKKENKWSKKFYILKKIYLN